ncbi:MAG: glycosyltransferase family 39 protein, partial [Chloroflexota bacterium]
MGKQAYRWGLVIVLLIAFGARVYRLDQQSFWNDEGNSASLSGRSAQLIIEGTASDVHPPLYYLILRGWWPLAGQTDFSLRYISVVAGVLQVAATIAIGRMWLSRTGALGVGILVSLSPPLVYYSQEARMYGLLGAIATFSMLTLLKGIKYEVESKKYEGAPHTYHLSLITSYCLLNILGLYTHYVYPAVILAQGCIVLLWTIAQAGFDVRSIRQKSWRWLVSVIVALLVYAPWFPIFLRTGSSTR